MRPWLQDPDGDGTYTWSSDQIPAGSYEFKVAHGLSLGRELRRRRQQRGSLSVPSDGTVVTICYVLATHQISREDLAGRLRAGPEARPRRSGCAATSWRGRPRRSRGHRPGLRTWRLHWSPTGGLAVDAEAVTGGSTRHAARTTPPGCPPPSSPRTPSSRATWPCGCPAPPPATPGRSCAARWPWAMYDNLGRLTDATGVQVPGVLDDLYAGAAVTRDATAVAGTPAARRSPLWAPTAQAVSLLVWPAGASGTAPVSDATRVAMRRGADGAWTVDRRAAVAGRPLPVRGARSTRPTTGKVETNLVTDPYSVALTLNSTRSVAVDLDRPGPAARAVAAEPGRRSSRRTSTPASTSCTCATSRSATRPCRRRTAAPTWRSPTTATAPSTSRRSPRRA